MFIEITVLLKCREDVPERILQWMCDSMAHHAYAEFSVDYEPEWTSALYQLTPLVDDSAPLAVLRRVDAEHVRKNYV